MADASRARCLAAGDETHTTMHRAIAGTEIAVLVLSITAGALFVFQRRHSRYIQARSAPLMIVSNLGGLLSLYSPIATLIGAGQVQCDTYVYALLAVSAWRQANKCAWLLQTSLYGFHAQMHIGLLGSHLVNACRVYAEHLHQQEVAEMIIDAEHTDATDEALALDATNKTGGKYGSHRAAYSSRRASGGRSEVSARSHGSGRSNVLPGSSPRSARTPPVTIDTAASVPTGDPAASRAAPVYRSLPTGDPSLTGRQQIVQTSAVGEGVTAPLSARQMLSTAQIQSRSATTQSAASPPTSLFRTGSSRAIITTFSSAALPSSVAVAAVEGQGVTIAAQGAPGSPSLVIAAAPTSMEPAHRVQTVAPRGILKSPSARTLLQHLPSPSPPNTKLSNGALQQHDLAVDAEARGPLEIAPSSSPERSTLLSDPMQGQRTEIVIDVAGSTLSAGACAGDGTAGLTSMPSADLGSIGAASTGAMEGKPASSTVLKLDASKNLYRPTSMRTLPLPLVVEGGVRGSAHGVNQSARLAASGRAVVAAPEGQVAQPGHSLSADAPLPVLLEDRRPAVVLRTINASDEVAGTLDSHLLHSSEAALIPPEMQLVVPRQPSTNISARHLEHIIATANPPLDPADSIPSSTSQRRAHNPTSLHDDPRLAQHPESALAAPLAQAPVEPTPAASDAYSVLETDVSHTRMCCGALDSIGCSPRTARGFLALFASQTVLWVVIIAAVAASVVSPSPSSMAGVQALRHATWGHVQATPWIQDADGLCLPSTNVLAAFGALDAAWLLCVLIYVALIWPNRDEFNLKVDVSVVLVAGSIAFAVYFGGQGSRANAGHFTYLPDSAFTALAIVNAWVTLIVPALWTVRSRWLPLDRSALAADRDLPGKLPNQMQRSTRCDCIVLCGACNAVATPRSVPSAVSSATRRSTADTAGSTPVGHERSRAASRDGKSADMDARESEHASAFGKGRIRSSLVVTETRSHRSLFDELLRDGLGRRLFAAHLQVCWHAGAFDHCVLEEAPYFHEYLQKELSLENLLFFVEVTRFRRRLTHFIVAREAQMLKAEARLRPTHATSAAAWAVPRSPASAQVPFEDLPAESLPQAVTIVAESAATGTRAACAPGRPAGIPVEPMAGTGVELEAGVRAAAPGTAWATSSVETGIADGRREARPKRMPPGTRSSVEEARGRDAAASRYAARSSHKRVNFASPLGYAVYLYQRYIASGAQFQVNLPQGIVRSIERKLDAAAAEAANSKGLPPPAPIQTVRNPYASGSGFRHGGSGDRTGADISLELAGSTLSALLVSSRAAAPAGAQVSRDVRRSRIFWESLTRQRSDGTSSGIVRYPSASVKDVDGGSLLHAEPDGLKTHGVPGPVPTLGLGAIDRSTSGRLDTGGFPVDADIAPADTFDDAQADVYALMLRDAFPRFLATKAFALWAERRPSAAKSVHRIRDKGGAAGQAPPAFKAGYKRTAVVPLPEAS